MLANVLRGAGFFLRNKYFIHSVEILPLLLITELITTFTLLPITQQPEAKRGLVGSQFMHHCSKYF